MAEQESARVPLPDDLPEEFQQELAAAASEPDLADDLVVEPVDEPAPSPEPEAALAEAEPEPPASSPGVDDTQAGQVTLPLPRPDIAAAAALPREPPPLSHEAQEDSAPRSPRRERAAPSTAPGGYRLATFVGGALLIALGVIYLWPLFANGDILVPEAILGVAVAGLSLGALAYWLGKGRDAPGALFAGLAGLLLVGIGLWLYAQPGVDLAMGWPLGVAAAGLAALLTFTLNRAHDRRLIALGLALLAAGIAGALVTLEQLPADVLAFARQYGAWLAVILALGLLPLAIRRGPNESSQEE